MCLVGLYEYGQSAFVRYWHLAGITLGAQNVCFRGKSGHHELTPSYPLMTQSGHVDAIALAIVPQNRELDMPDYMFFMHDDARDGENDWEPYLTKLKANGSFEGGSAIGNGVCVRKGGEVPSLTAHLTGYIRVNADDLDHARSLLAGNPHFEAGGTVEIRALPRTD